MLWALETTRSSVECSKLLRHAQRFQIARMMDIRRRRYDNGAVEDWLEWHIRRMREAKRVIKECNIDIVEILKTRKNSFASHISRFGLSGKEQHLVKHVLLWRSLAWWREQQQYNATIDDHFKFLHLTSSGRPRRWESQFKADWMLKVEDEPSS